jgi:hypothetical protein
MSSGTNQSIARGFAIAVLGVGTAIFFGWGPWTQPQVHGASKSLVPDQGQAEGLGERERTAVLNHRTPVGMSNPPSSPVLDRSEADDMLQSYYAADADLVRAALEDRGIDLSTLPAPMPEAEFHRQLPSWFELTESERDSRKEAELDWPDQLTNTFLNDYFSVEVDLSHDELAGIDAMADLFRPDIELAVDRYFDHLDVAFAIELEAGSIKGSPFLVWPPEPKEDVHEKVAHANDAFFSIIRSGQGWVARAALTQQNHPEAYMARSALAQAVERRNHDIYKSLVYLQQ